MSYVRSVLQPNEKILVIGRLHWIVYMQAILLLVVGILLVALGSNLTNESIVSDVRSTLDLRLTPGRRSTQRP